MGKSLHIYIKDEELDAWVRENVGSRKRFRSYSHAVETALDLLRRKAEETPGPFGAI